jgi:hypothetical protein
VGLLEDVEPVCLDVELGCAEDDGLLQPVNKDSIRQKHNINGKNLLIIVTPYLFFQRKTMYLARTLAFPLASFYTS